jgi:dTDP-4-dehydrorhamnose reductase
MQILVTGGNGQLGRELYKASPEYPDHKFYFTDVNDLDLRNRLEVEKELTLKHPDIIINCAAYTDVNKAEEEKELATELNAAIPGYLSEIASEIGAKLIHFSTDYIFNGNGFVPYVETDIPDPQSQYAITKLKGEEEILRHNTGGFIFRTSWLYSEFGANFVKTILRKAREVKEIRVVNDQTGTPTYARDMAETVLRLLPEVRFQKSVEIFNYSSEGIVSWFDFASAIIEMSGLDCTVIPISTAEFPQAAKRPTYSVLDKTKIRNRFGIEIPDWRSSLRKCLDNLRNHTS